MKTCARCHQIQHTGSCEDNHRVLLSIRVRPPQSEPQPAAAMPSQDQPDVKYYNMAQETKSAPESKYDAPRPRCQFFVAPPGSGKSTLCRNDRLNVDLEVLVPPPVGRYWDNAHVLKQYHDELALALQQAERTAAPGTRFWYNTSLPGRAADAVYLIPADLHRRNLEARESAGTLWTRLDTDQVMNGRPLVDGTYVYAVPTLLAFRTPVVDPVARPGAPGKRDAINFAFRPTAAQQEWCENLGRRVGAEVTFKKAGVPATAAHPHGITATARTSMIQLVLAWLVHTGAALELMIVGSQPHRWAVTNAVYNMCAVQPNGRIDTERDAFWSQHSVDAVGGRLGMFRVCTDPPERCNCMNFDYAVLEHCIYDWTPDQVWMLAKRTRRMTVISIHHTYAAPVGQTAGGEHHWVRNPDGSVEVTLGTHKWTHAQDLAWLAYADVDIDARRSLHAQVVETGLDGSIAVTYTALHTRAPVNKLSRHSMDVMAALSAEVDATSSIDDPRIGRFIQLYATSPLTFSGGFIMYAERDKKIMRLPVQLIQAMLNKLSGAVTDDSMALLLRTFAKPYEMSKIVRMLTPNENANVVMNRCAHVAALVAADNAVADEAANIAVRQRVQTVKHIRTGQYRVCNPLWLAVSAVVALVATVAIANLLSVALLAIHPMPLHHVCTWVANQPVSCDQERLPFSTFGWLYYWARGIAHVGATPCGIFDVLCQLQTAVGYEVAANSEWLALAFSAAVFIDHQTGELFQGLTDRARAAVAGVPRQLMAVMILGLFVLAMVAVPTCEQTWYGQYCSDGTRVLDLSSRAMSVDRWTGASADGPIPLLSFAGATTKRPYEPMRWMADVEEPVTQPHNFTPIQFSIGIVCQKRPRVFARNVRNEYGATRNRLAAEPPPLNATAWAFHRAWLLHPVIFDEVFPEPDEFPAPNFAQWLADRPFTGVQRMLLQRAHDEICANQHRDRDVYKTSAFVKLENGEFIEDNVVEDKDPRLIASSTPHYNATVAPYIHETTRIIKRCWTRGHYITYAPGYRADQLGVFADRADDVVSECDYSKYDASRHAGTHELERAIMRKLGADRWPTIMGRPVTAIMREGCTMRGRSHHGIRYVIPGVLCSGRPDTSMGNTVINGTSKFAGACYAARADPTAQPDTHHAFPTIDIDAKRLPPVPPSGHTFGPPPLDCDNDNMLAWLKRALRAGARPAFGTVRLEAMRYRSLVAGDDHAATHARIVDLARVDAWDAALGFKLKRPHRRHIDEVTFCSAHFLKMYVDGRERYVLAPDWRRVIPRIGWTVNPGYNVHNPLVRAAVNRGNALSLYDVSRGVPMLRVYVDRVLELTQGVDAKMPYIDKRKTVGKHQYRVHPEAYARYNITPADEREYGARLRAATQLPAYVALPWTALALSLFAAASWGMYVAPFFEEWLRCHIFFFYFFEVMVKVINGHYVGAALSLGFHTAILRVPRYMTRWLVHFLWNVGAYSASRGALAVAVGLLLLVQPGDAACSTAHVARAFETPTNKFHVSSDVRTLWPHNLHDNEQTNNSTTNFTHANPSHNPASSPLFHARPHRPRSQDYMRPKGARASRSRRAIRAARTSTGRPAGARRQRRLRTRRGRQRTGPVAKRSRPPARAAKDVGGPLRRGFALGPGAKIEKRGRAEPADTGESGTRFVATQELGSVVVGSSTSGDVACLKIGSSSPASAIVIDAFLLADRIYQELVMYDKAIFRQFMIDFVPLAGEAIAGSITAGIVEDADVLANNFGGTVTRQKIEDLDNNRMVPLTRRVRLLNYRTHSRAPYYVDAGSGEDSHFYAQLAMVALVTGATTANTTYGILQVRAVIDVYGRTPVQTLIQGNGNLRLNSLLRAVFRGDAVEPAVLALLRRLPRHGNCAARIDAKQLGACNRCNTISRLNSLTRDVPRIAEPPLQSVQMYGQLPDGSVAPVIITADGKIDARIYDKDGRGAVFTNAGYQTVQVIDGGGGDGSRLSVTNSGSVPICATNGNSVFTSGGALAVTETLNGTVISKPTITTADGKTAIGVAPYYSGTGAPGTAVRAFASSVGVAAASAATPAGTDLTTVNGVSSAITAIGTTTSAVSNGYLAVAGATGQTISVVPMLTDPQSGNKLPQAGSQVQTTGIGSTGTALPMAGQSVYDQKDGTFVGLPTYVAGDASRPIDSNFSTPLTGVSRVGQSAPYLISVQPDPADVRTLVPVVPVGQLQGTATDWGPRRLQVISNGSLYVNTSLELPPELAQLRAKITDPKQLASFDEWVLVKFPAAPPDAKGGQAAKPVGTSRPAPKEAPTDVPPVATIGLPVQPLKVEMRSDVPRTGT